MTSENKSNQIRGQVRERYANVVRQRAASCCSAEACCGTDTEAVAHAIGLGYSDEEARSIPEGANLSLGCGNPQAIASLQPGETVLDLGSGAGFDCFLAARQVGDGGRVIGVDMTPDMLARARENARQAGYGNVTFRLGEIEHLPVANNQIDVIISNCVINLSPDKQAVFDEAYRVLKPGSRLAIADTVATAPLPEEAQKDMALWSACISGAAPIDDLAAMLRAAGFEEIRIRPKDESREMIREWVPGSRAEDYIVSATIEAVKPR